MNIEELDERTHEKRCDNRAYTSDCNNSPDDTARNKEKCYTEDYADKIGDDAHVLELAFMPCVHNNKRNCVIG